MISSADLFSLALLATGGLYACMLAYFSSIVGSKRASTRIVWNSEPLVWIITLMLTYSIAFRIVEPEAAAGPGIWYLIGTGNLMVIYIYLITELARHDLPAVGYWSVAGLSAAAFFYLVVTAVMALFAQTMDLELYKNMLATLLAALTHILMIVLLYNFIRSLHSSMLRTWMVDSNDQTRLKAGGVAVSVTGEVSQPESALSDIHAETAADAGVATLAPGSSIVVDFGSRRIEDHGFRSDLRIASSSAEQLVAVEVSNDKANWFACFREKKIPSDWDVPFFDSPWRFVRVSNSGAEPVEIAEVYDLD
ncbi:MAG: hypothetical protein WDZ52_08315 [Pseudohongiellaceae bacterium]